MTTEARRYRSDDRDLPDGDNDLLVFAAENGDWYIAIVRHGEKLGPAVRLTTSGSPRGLERVPVAVAKLFDALGGHDEGLCTCGEDSGTGPSLPHKTWCPRA
jgi:hypothetical protein